MTSPGRPCSSRRTPPPSLRVVPSSWTEVGRHDKKLALVPLQLQNGTMLNLSIKEVPDDIGSELRERAARNHRSIQGELMSILEAAVRPRPFRAEALVRQIQAL